MQNPRDRRLQVDHEKVLKLVNESGGTLRLLQTSGSPATRFVIEYHCPSLIKDQSGRVVTRDVHQVEITLGSTYPSTAPSAKLLTPIFNPHVFSHKGICLGVLQNNWNVTLTLDIVILEIGALLQLDPRVLNPSSPANHDANDWVQKNRSKLPLGKVSFKARQDNNQRIQWS